MHHTFFLSPALFCLRINTWLDFDEFPIGQAYFGINVNPSEITFETEIMHVYPPLKRSASIRTGIVHDESGTIQVGGIIKHNKAC